MWRGVLFSLSLKDSLHFWRIKLQHVKIIILTCLVGSCRFVFTINNYTDEDIDYLENTDLFHYVCYGREVGENLTPHLQGYFEFKNGNRKSLSACISALGKDGCPSKPHIEVAMGTAAQAIAYCEKMESFGKRR